MPRPRISLVMPNYNHGRFIGSALRALLTQTRPADEIIVIDDASTDDSVEIVERLARIHPGISLVRHRGRGGVLAALNEGLEQANGDLIAFPAADDLVESDFLAESERLLLRFPDAPFCSACVALVDAEDTNIGVRPILRPLQAAGYASSDTVRALLTRGDNFFLGNVALYRRQNLRRLGGFDLALGSAADGMMMRRMAVRWGFCFVPKILGVWRLHGANFSAAAIDSPEKLGSLIEANRRIISAEPTGLFPDSYSEIFERRLRFNAARLMLQRQGGSAPRPDALEILLRMIRATWVDVAAIRGFRWLGPAATTVSVWWLALRLRPYSFIWLGKEYARRMFSKRPHPKSDLPEAERTDASAAGPVN